MRRACLVSTFALGALLLYGCGSGGDNSGGGGSGGSSSPTAGAAGCDKDLTGTWDLFATRIGSTPASGIMIVGPDGFTVTTDGGQLTYNAQGTKSATWAPTTGAVRSIAVQNTPASVKGGSIPVVLGGHWIVSATWETCTLDVASSAILGTCHGRPGEYTVSAEDWPYTIPTPENDLLYTISRTSTLASQFGDFGGIWTARSSTGSGQHCTITLQGNTITVDCQTQTEFAGVTHLTVGSDCVASGTTPSGLEVGARRR
jgi:hypothetical protein